MKNQVSTVDATPSKRLYLSIIADYDVNKSICELIDNALDIWTKTGRKRQLNIDIWLDPNQQRIEVVDNAGGILESELSFVVGPGHSGNAETDETIGIFGVGTKRAVVALAQDISIRTCRDGATCLISFDDDWIKDNEEWNLPVFRVDAIQEGTTRIELIKLRRPITADVTNQLREHLGATYAYFLRHGNVSICLNKEAIKPITFDEWAFPPGYEPKSYSGTLPTESGVDVEVRAIAGLAMESSPAGGEYGVYIYCNDRLIARALKTYDVGFATGLAGKPHADISLTRVIVFLRGPAVLMPWNSSKSDINPKHEVFVALRDSILSMVKYYASLARRLSKYEGSWSENVFKYESGSVQKVEIEDFLEVKTAYRAPLPVVRKRYNKIVEDLNRPIAEDKPWVVGLYESIIAIDSILRLTLEQKNRIALLLLDNTLEIAFKEFLVRESGERYSNNRLQVIFSNRVQVHNEVAKHSNVTPQQWSKIEHYYDTRSQLTHRRATASITDQAISDFRSLVETILADLFGLRFSS